MGKKPYKKLVEEDKNTVKIWCTDRDNFQYIKVCDMNCKKKNTCAAYKDHLEPKLF